MYGQNGQKTLQELRDHVDDLREDFKDQRAVLRRLIGGMITCAVIIALSAMANGYNVLPNGGNGGIIAVSAIAWLSLIVGTSLFFDEKWDANLGPQLRASERDLKRMEAVEGERTAKQAAEEWPRT
jgi:hypothetical protein